MTYELCKKLNPYRILGCICFGFLGILVTQVSTIQYFIFGMPISIIGMILVSLEP